MNCANIQYSSFDGKSMLVMSFVRIFFYYISMYVWRVLIGVSSVSHIVFGIKRLELIISDIFVFFFLRGLGITDVICANKIK